jgi:hypothetical protein
MRPRELFDSFDKRKKGWLTTAELADLIKSMIPDAQAGDLRYFQVSSAGGGCMEGCTVMRVQQDAATCCSPEGCVLSSTMHRAPCTLHGSKKSKYRTVGTLM